MIVTHGADNTLRNASGPRPDSHAGIFAPGFRLGRECDGYNTRKGKKSATARVVVISSRRQRHPLAYGLTGRSLGVSGIMAKSKSISLIEHLTSAERAEERMRQAASDRTDAELDAIIEEVRHHLTAASRLDITSKQEASAVISRLTRDVLHDINEGAISAIGPWQTSFLQALSRYVAQLRED